MEKMILFFILSFIGCKSQMNNISNTKNLQDTIPIYVMDIIHSIEVIDSTNYDPLNDGIASLLIHENSAKYLIYYKSRLSKVN